MGADADIGAEGYFYACFVGSGEGCLDAWADLGGFLLDGVGEVAIDLGFLFDELAGVDGGDEVGAVLDEECDGFVV